MMPCHHVVAVPCHNVVAVVVHRLITSSKTIFTILPWYCMHKKYMIVL